MVPLLLSVVIAPLFLMPLKLLLLPMEPLLLSSPIVPLLIMPVKPPIVPLPLLFSVVIAPLLSMPTKPLMAPLLLSVPRPIPDADTPAPEVLLLIDPVDSTVKSPLFQF